MESQFHEGFYSFAKYYDIAFDFKNVPQECRFLESVFTKHTQRPLTSFIEFGSGPALHCIEMARTLKQVTAVDLSSEMTAYAKFKAQQAGVNVNCECADMIHYQSTQRYDLTTLLMDSTSYLLTNANVIDHLRSVAGILNPGGLYILEMSHPKGIFEMAKTTVNDWEMERDGVRVKIKWGAEGDEFDPITQLTNVSVKLEYTDGEKTGTIEDQSPQRCFTATEFAALVAASGVFEIVEYYGAMKSEVPFNNEEKAWRMVPILRKI
jgi:2-polyprenyl-3-methyl-5-hydroxy-6-metoxy-1,4-benzoquinol methylase